MLAFQRGAGRTRRVKPAFSIPYSQAYHVSRASTTKIFPACASTNVAGELGIRQRGGIDGGPATVVMYSDDGDRGSGSGGSGGSGSSGGSGGGGGAGDCLPISSSVATPGFRSLGVPAVAIARTRGIQREGAATNALALFSSTIEIRAGKSIASLHKNMERNTSLLNVSPGFGLSSDSLSDSVSRNVCGMRIY